MTEKLFHNNSQISNTGDANPMWGGHFKTGAHEIMAEINASIGFDNKLYRHDIRGSLAHVAMLAFTGIISDDEAEQISKGLQQIEQEIHAGQMVWKPEFEDIHMHVEARLKELIGEVAGKLHTARSRNDQVATDFKLYVIDACDMLVQHIIELQQVLLAQAECYADTIMPGFTHLQTAQPITFGHHLMAYVEMLQRDKTRFADARRRMNTCPLGSAALAGTSYPINRTMTAQALGFDAPTRNSLDGVGSRDFALEFLSAASICGVHLSRLAEELVIWSSALVKFVSLPENFTSGSSIMPQKRNPDAAELVRAKTGRLNGNLIHLLTVIKGTTLAYNKDLQEDKEPVFDTVAALQLCLSATAHMLAGIKVHKDAMIEAASGGFSTATDVADWLVQQLGLPFRDAHHVTGRIVALAEAKACYLWELSLHDMQAIESRINDSIFNVLSVAHSVRSRTSFGGTAPDNVREAIIQARKDYAL
jgi:argininosuccinate lyase